MGETATQGAKRTLARWRTGWTDWRRKRFWLLAAFLLYSLLGFYLAPWQVKRTLVATFEQAGRKASVEQVRVNPWLFKLSVQGVQVIDPDGVPVLGFREAACDFELVSLLRWAWTFQDVRMHGLRLVEERFDVLDTRLWHLAEALAGEPDSQDSAEPEELPRLIFGQLSIDDTRIHLIDHTAGDFETDLGPIDIIVHDLRTLPGHQSQQSVTILTAYGDRIEWQGSLQFGPLQSEGRLSLVGNTMHDSLAYLDHLQPFGLKLDAVQLELDYHFSRGEAGAEFVLDSLRTQIEGLRARLDGADSDILTLGRLDVEDARLQWPQQVVQVKAVRMEGLMAQAVLEPDGRINLERLLPAADQAPAPATTAGPPWQLGIGQISLGDGSVNLLDQTMQPAVEVGITGLQLALTEVDNQDGTQIPTEMSLALASGGSIGFKGLVTVLPDVAIEGRLNVEALALAVLQAHLQQHARVELQSGTLTMDTGLRWQAATGPALQGALSIDGLELADTLKNERLAGWKRMRIDAFEADLGAGELKTSQLLFDEPFGRLHIAEDLSTNVSDVLVTAPDDGADGTGQPLRVAVEGMAFENGGLDFSDLSLPLPFRAEIRNLDGTVGALATDSEQPAPVELGGQVNRYGEARIEGDLNAWDPTAKADITMTFRNLEMERLTPYTVQFAGYAIEAGRMDLDLRYLLEKQQLQGENKIVIRELDLGEKVEHPDAGSLPLRLAVALLTDAEGVIDIDLPVRGDLNDPQFKISGIIWRALGNLITKAVTAPFRLLGALVGVDSEDFGTLGFTPGSAELSPPDREQLVKLAEAMAQRPELSLKVGGVTAPEVDLIALQTQMLDALLEERIAASDSTVVARRREALEALFAEQLPEVDVAALQAEFTSPASAEGEPGVLDEPAYLAALHERLVAIQPIGEAELATLAQARMEAVLAGLVTTPTETPLRVVQAEATTVEVDERGEVPLELAVEAD